jgi:hypothetical protein
MVKEPKTLQEAAIYFAGVDNCIEYLADKRWPDGVVVCPDCGRKDATYVPARRVWQCKTRHPKAQFSIKVGTIFEDSPVPLGKWLMAMWMIANCKNGVSSWELHRTIGVTQKTAWFMRHRIGMALQDGSSEMFGGSESGPVEVDEAFIGGEPKNKHLSHRMKTKRTVKNEAGEWVFNPNFRETRGRASKKTPVMGMIDRETRKARAQVIPGIDRKVLQDLILDNVSKGSKVFTDGLPEYQSLKAMGFVHDTVNHLSEYVRGEVHTNGIENFWSLLKRGLRGTYVAVEPFHLDRYVTEQIFRYNNRATKDNPLNDSDRFALAVSQIVGKRLTYAELTGKVEGAEN